MPPELFRAPPSPPRESAALRAHGPPPQIMLCVPAYGCMVSNTFLHSLLALLPALHSRGVACQIQFIGNESLVQRARNTLAGQFVHVFRDCTHLLFVDADIGFEPDSVLRLLYFLVKHDDEDIACAAYAKKDVDWARVAAKLDAGGDEPTSQAGLDFNINLPAGEAGVLRGLPAGEAGVLRGLRDGFAPVSEGATGFMMIRRRALERMYEAFGEELRCRNDVPGQMKALPEYVAVFDCAICPATRRYLSEDYAFCRRWGGLGGRVWMDLLLPLAHEGTHAWRGDLRARLADLAA